MAAQFFGIAQTPVICDLIDEGSVIERKRIDATYNAIMIFFTHFGALVWAFMIWLIHGVLTDYNPALGANQSPGAILGIRAQISIIPAFFFLVGAICFIALWKLNPERVKQVKLQLQELNI
jgi:Na+/melibiose symporter-like transporter